MTENGEFCGAFVIANPLQISNGQVRVEPCNRRDVYYVCDDTHRIRYINYYHPKNSEPKTSKAGHGDNGAGQVVNGAGPGVNGAGPGVNGAGAGVNGARQGVNGAGER